MIFPGSETKLLKGLELGNSGIISAVCNVTAPLVRKVYDDFNNKKKQSFNERLCAIRKVFDNYNLVSAGVVNKDNKLVGMITADDVVTVVQEEAEEDALRLAGVGDEEITDSVIVKTKRRFNWLLLNLFTALLATWVISNFGASIEQMVALAFLMPIVASMGGNAGMQTLAVTIRALSLIHI